MNHQIKVCAGLLLTIFGVHAQQDNPALQILDEVVVSDSRFELKREQSGKNVIRIDAAEIARNEGKTVAALLNSKAGIEIAGSRGRQGEVLGVFARGGRGRQVLVLIDGVRVSDPSSSSQDYDLRLLSLADIESIEIIKGASSVLYGSNAATAVINITTKSIAKAKFRTTVASSLGTNQSADDQDYSISSFNNSARISGSVDSFLYDAGISQVYTDNLSSLRTAGNEEDPFSNYSAGIKIGYKFSDSVLLKIYGDQTRMKTAYDESFGLMDAPYRYSTEQNRAGVAFKTWYRKGEFNLNGAYTKFHSENISAFPGTFTGQNYVVDAYAKYTFGNSLYALCGLNLIRDKATFGSNKEFTILDPYLNVVYLSHFGLNLNMGARLNTHSEYGNHWVYSFNPSYRYSLGAGYLKLLGSIASSYITPSLTQLFGEFGANPDLQPETNRTLESGLEWVWDNRFRASFLYFSRKEENFVFFDSADFLYRNSTGTIEAKGLEVEASWEPTTAVQLEANYTFTDRQGDNAIRIPRHKLNAELGIQIAEGCYTSIQYSYTGSRPDTDFNTFTDTTLDPYSLINLYISRDLCAGNMKVFLRADNLFNTAFTEIIGFSTRGRNVSMGFNLKL